MNKAKKRLKLIGAMALFAILISVIIISHAKKEEVLNFTYDELISYVQNEQIMKVEVPKGGNEVTAITVDGKTGKTQVLDVETLMNFLQKQIEEGKNLKVEVVSEDASFDDIISTLSSLFFLIFPIYLFIRLARGMTKTFDKAEGNFGKTLEEMMGGSYEVKPVTSKVRFTDVAGIDEEMEQLKEIVDFLKNPDKYTSMGARIPKGILLNGEPGTGKTLMARAIAGEAGVPFFQENGSNFEEKFVGVGADRMRKLFKAAKEKAPCIIFIDEFDSIAQSRYSGHSYSEQTLNELLSEMDGFESVDNVVVIAATNHIEVLDSAITRRGRFDRHIYVPMPDVKARQEILKVHVRNKQIAENVNLAELAEKTSGFSGADLESLLNEASIHAVRNGKNFISLEDIDEAIAIVLVGLQKKNKAVTQEDKRLTAIHEAGHAIISAVLRPEVKNFEISIIPRGGAGGYNFFGTSEKTYKGKKEIINDIKVCYGGRAAEEIILGDISSGASGDLESASKMAIQMITRYGMNGTLMVQVGGEHEYNKKLSTEAINAAEKICKTSYEDVKNIIEKYKSQLLALAALLIQKERLTQEEVSAFMKENL